MSKLNPNTERPEHPSLFVIEDSTQAFLGGGQKVTLSLLRAVMRGAKIEVMDWSLTSRFSDQVTNMGLPKHKLLGAVPSIAKPVWRVFGLIVFVVTLPLNVAVLYYKCVAASKVSPRVILLACTKRAALLAALIKLGTNVEFLFYAHSVETEKKLSFSLFSLILKKVDQIICCSNNVADQYKSFPTEIVLNPVSMGLRKSFRIPSDPMVVGYVGSLIEIKGIEYFLDAMAQMKHKSVRGIIVGDGPLMHSLRQKYSQVAAFVGFVDDVERIFDTQLDILVLPSLVEEASPLVINEAFASAIPVITTNLGGQAVLVSDGYNGLLVTPGDASELRDAMLRIVDDKNLYEQLSRGALATARTPHAADYTTSICRILRIPVS